MDDKFLRDKINDDNIEIPESLLPENISKLLEKSEEKVNGLAGESDIDGRVEGTNENIVNIKGINEKTVNESDKKNREKRQMIKYLRSCALAAAALIVVLAGASMMGRLRENKYTAADQTGNPVPGTDMPETMEETFVCGTTQAAGDTDMNKTKYDELYDKLVCGNAYNITTDGGYYITNDVQAADGESSTQADGIYNETTAENGRWNASTKDPDASDDEGTKGEETGDNFSGNNDQEEGVSEGNIFSTDGKYLYILKKPDDVYMGTRSLVIYSADDGELGKCSEISLGMIKDSTHIDYGTMYVEQDKLILTGYAYNGVEYWEKSGFTFAVIYDISDRTAPKYVNTLTQSGYNISSRITDGVLYMVSWYTPSTSCTRDEYEKYIPMYNNMLVGEDNIYCPVYINDRSYTVIGSVELDNPTTYKDTEAVVLNPDNMYVSRNAIYFLEQIYEYRLFQDYVIPEEIQNGDGTTQELNNKEIIKAKDVKNDESQTLDDDKTKSKLVKLTIDKGNIEFAASTEVYGSADNQFSFCEYNGYLRLVTTTRDYESREQSCGLYIFDEELNMVGHIDELARGESIKSSRFLGNMVYFVTFRNTDPLFAVDASNPENPVIVNEVKLPGFSEYLHPYGDGLLFGLGYEADESDGRLQNVKMSMFDISNPADIVEVDREQLEAFYSGAMYEHRAMLVNPKRNLIGFAVEENVIEKDGAGANVYGRLAQIYRLYSYDENEGFVQHIECVLDLYSYDYPRANYIGDYLYIFDGARSVYTYRLTDYEFLGITVL